MCLCVWDMLLSAWAVVALLILHFSRLIARGCLHFLQGCTMNLMGMFLGQSINILWTIMEVMILICMRKLPNRIFILFFLQLTNCELIYRYFLWSTWQWEHLGRCCCEQPCGKCCPVWYYLEMRTSFISSYLELKSSHTCTRYIIAPIMNQKRIINYSFVSQKVYTHTSLKYISLVPSNMQTYVCSIHTCPPSLFDCHCVSTMACIVSYAP
jgi:hypothetical protein